MGSRTPWGQKAVLMKKEKKEKRKDKQYKLKKAMAIAIGLNTLIRTSWDIEEN